uniref:Uncharacterized protein n=1 Tax=Panthera tigris altaica TaxID=74533 RepID=A0A8C9JCU7_PANTA
LKVSGKVANSNVSRYVGCLSCLRSHLGMAYRNGKVDETLSPGFQRCRIGGDLAKFTGCYLTNQLPIE